MPNKTLCLIDANSLLYRAYHALPSLTSPDGRPSGGVYGFTMLLLKVLEEFQPHSIAIAWDLPTPTFRHEQFSSYKANRPPAPEDLIWQKEKAQEMLNLFGFSQFSSDGYEADDIIGTLSVQATSEGFNTVIVTGDMDALQLVNEQTKVYTAKGTSISETVLIDVEGVKNKLGGILPDQVVDYKALRGDPSDNIPGVKGVGEKTAIRLLLQFQDLNGIYSHLNEIGGRTQTLLTDGKESAYMSQVLARIDCNVPIPIDWEKLQLNGLDKNIMWSFFTEMGFKSLLKRLDGVVSKWDTSASATASTLFQSIDVNNTGDIDPYAFDYQIAAHLLRGSSGAELGLRSLASEWLGIQLYDDPNSNDEVKALVFQLSHKLRSELELVENLKLKYLFYEIEMPIKKILNKMEKDGVLVDVDKVRNLLVEYETQLQFLEKEIYQSIGKEFNLNSPKQLEVILFDELRLPVLKKTKTQRSTDESVLLKLHEMHPMIGSLLKYRQLHKIKSTYIEPMLSLVDDHGRVHTTFNQTKTASGRLSSENPNMQNIPLDPETGMRSLFIAPKDHVLVVADYSQIELRLMAHLSGDARLINSFSSSQDIHAATAARIFNKFIGDVAKMERQVGKTINFALMYGITSHGLSDQLGIDRVKAEYYIENFYKSYPEVKAWQEKIIAQAKIDGYVETMYGRRRYLPELLSSNFHIRSAAERIAINHPLQGSQADLIKIAMANIDKRLHKSKIDDSARMILQVHDELVLEAGSEIKDHVATIVKEEMENVIQLSVPVIVDVSTGSNWQDAKGV